MSAYLDNICLHSILYLRFSNRIDEKIKIVISVNEVLEWSRRFIDESTPIKV